MQSSIDNARTKQKFLPIDELLARHGETNIILDASILMSEGVEVGKNNVFYPNVVIEQQGEGKISLGSNNVFYPGTYILSSAGSITVGDGNEFGAGGCTIKANISDAVISIGDGGRYCDGASIMGRTTLGSGSQVLGNITVQGCTLASGGTFQAPDPDERAAVLKGFGLARGVTLEKGQVVNGAGNFAERPIEWQHDYHPKPKAQ
jgi:acetyltransferase-like isoleucine patch superfamily enzyme